MAWDCMAGIPRKVKIYDCEKKHLIMETSTLTEAANYLGIHVSLVRSTIKNKSRNKTNKLGLTITCR